MKFLKYIIALLIVFSFSGAYAASNADSSAQNINNLSVPVPNPTVGNSGWSGNTVTSVSYTEFQYGTCPAGWTYNGGTQYPLQARTVSNNYISGQYVGTTYSAWYDMDASCGTTEYQQIPCPAGYTGVYYQSRQLSANDGWIDYSPWTTYANSCQLIPPPPPPAPSCKYDSNNYVHRVIPPFWGSPDYYSVWNSSIDIAMNGTKHAQAADSGIYGYDNYVNAYLSAYGATLGDLVSQTFQGDTGISDVYNKICF